MRPPSTWVRFRARAADSVEALEAELFAPVALQPDDASPADLGAALSGTPGGAFGDRLEIEIALGAEAAGLTSSVSSVSVTASCAGEPIE